LLEKKLLGAPIEYAKRARTETLEPSKYRDEFKRDRDRVLYSKEFRRLSGKTQVFLSTADDQIRTRLTHTLEVSQISRTIADYLELNSVLTEAISLGHDVGHTPFGHAGENSLRHIMNNCYSFDNFQKILHLKDKGFKHNLQSLRVVCDLEQLYNDPGLNLTNYTLWGILNHTKKTWGKCENRIGKECFLIFKKKNCCNPKGPYVDFYNSYLDKVKLYNGNEAWSFEGAVVKIADEIAQRHHDIEDAIHLEIITIDELLDEIQRFYHFLFNEEDNFLIDKMNENKDNIRLFIPYVSKFIVGFLSRVLTDNSATNLNNFKVKHRIKRREDFIKIYPKLSYDEVEDMIDFPADLKKNEREFHDFLKQRILNSFEVQRMDGKGGFIIRQLFKAYLKNPRQLHDTTINYIDRIFRKGKGPINTTLNKRDLGGFRKNIDKPDFRKRKDFQIALLRGICDHIAGMTDDFALSEYKRLYG